MAKTSGNSESQPKTKAAGILHAARNNVIQFPARPVTRQLPVPEKLAHAQLTSHELSSNVFGFSRGDTLICRTDFDASQIKPDSLVIAGDSLTVFSAVNVDHVSAVVLYLLRELS